MASIRPNTQWAPKDPDEKQAWIEYRRSLDPYTKLLRMTIGRFVKLRDPPIPPTASATSLDMDAIPNTGDGSSVDPGQSAVESQVDQVKSAE